ASLALILIEHGHAAEARSEWEIVAAHDFADLPRDRFFINGLVTMAQIATALDDARRAGILYDLLVPFAERTAVIGWASGCNGAGTAGRGSSGIDAAGRSQRAGSRGAPPPRRGPEQCRDRRRAGAQREHGHAPHRQHLRQARSAQPLRSDWVCAPPWPCVAGRHTRLHSSC